MDSSEGLDIGRAFPPGVYIRICMRMEGEKENKEGGGERKEEIKINKLSDCKKGNTNDVEDS